MSGAGLRRAGVLATTVALVVAGCLTDPQGPTEAPTATPQPEATATVTRYPLETTVWYGGLELAFGSATATLDAKGGPVAVSLTLSNPGAVEVTLDGPIRLASGGTELEPTRETILPLVAAGGAASTTVSFEADAAFDVSAATLVVGRPTEHQAIVPLAAGTAEPVTLQPVIVELTVEGQAGSLFVELYRAELRAGLPDWNQQLPSGRLVLTLTYNATFRADFAGGFAFTAENIGLRLPDGTVIKPRRDGHSQSLVIIAPGNREVDLSSRFEVPSPGSGTYALVVADAAATKALPFEVVLP